MSHPRYPWSWPQISPVPAGFAAIAGQYVDGGDSEPELEARANRLVDALHLERGRQADRVEIRQPGATERFWRRFEPVP